MPRSINVSLKHFLPPEQVWESQSVPETGTCETSQYWGWWAASPVHRNARYMLYLTRRLFPTALGSFTVWGLAKTMESHYLSKRRCDFAIHKSLHLQRVMPPAHVCMWDTPRNCEKRQQRQDGCLWRWLLLLPTKICMKQRSQSKGTDLKHNPPDSKYIHRC